MASFLENLLGLGAGEATMEAAGNNFAEINRGAARGENYLNAGAAGARDSLTKLLGQYAPLNSATGLYADAIGLGGADGNARATDAFTASPGYNFSVNQGIQAIDRNRAARGSFQSGGAEADVMDYVTGRASQEHGNWLNRLMGASGTALSGTAAGLNSMAGVHTGLAGSLLGNDQLYTGARVDNNNMYADGGEQNAQGIANLGGNLMGLAGRALGGGMGGFGGFGGATPGGRGRGGF